MVSDNSDEPRLSERQLEVLHRVDPARLTEPERFRAWSMLVATDDRRRPRRERSIDAVRRWGRRFGVAVGLLVSVLVARLTFLASGPNMTILPLIVGAVFGEAAGWISARLFAEWACSQSLAGVGGRR